MLMTVKELAGQLNVKPSTLYAWAGQGRIPCIRIHGLVRFRRDDIERWVESFRTQESPIALKAAPRGPRTALDELIARAKGQAYNPPHGETRPKSSLIGKEEHDGAREA